MYQGIHKGVLVINPSIHPSKYHTNAKSGESQIKESNKVTKRKKRIGKSYFWASYKEYSEEAWPPPPQHIV